MGRTEHTSYKVKLNTNLLEVFEDGIIKENNKGKDIFFENVGELDCVELNERGEKCRAFEPLFLYGNKTKTELTSNSLPVYIQILDWSNIKLHKAIKEMGGVCVFRHTDMALCISKPNRPLNYCGTSADFADADDIPDTTNIWDSWGKTKTESFHHLQYKHFDSIMRTDRACHFPTLTEWKTYDYNSSNQYEDIIKLAIEKGGLLIQGRAGTGKDYVIEKGLPNLPALCKLALTNMASLLMGGTTIHKALGINTDDLACGVMMRQYKNHQIIVINEISMIPKSLWSKLCLVKKLNPHSIFIPMGDYRQCKPIEEQRIDVKDYDYFNSSIVRYLSNGNRIELTERQRYDIDLWDMLENYYENGIMPDLPYSTPNLNAKKICYYNRTRKSINRLCMNGLKTPDAMFLDFEDDYDDPSLYKQQPVFIYNGMPVMSVKNNKDFDIVNGNQYKIKSFNKTTIVLDDNTEIPTDKFHPNFVVNYISTTHKLQGQTIDDDLYIYDYNTLSKDKHLGYTAFSRVKHLRQLHIASA
jgi:hypothetical protein